MCIFFMEIKDVIFAVQDEFTNYIRVNGNTQELIAAPAKSQGRFYMLFSLWVAAIPFLVDSFVWYKVWAIGAVLLSAVVIGWIVKKRMGMNEAFLVLVFFFSLYEVNDQYNLVVSYPLFLQCPLIFLGLSVELFLQYLETKSKWKGIVSAVFLFVACLFNEAFLLTTGIYVLLALNKKIISVAEIKELLVRIKYPLISAIVYFSIYVVFRKNNPSNYGGNCLYNANINEMIRVMFTFMFGQLPLMSFGRIFQISSLPVSTVSIIKAIVTGFGSYKILSNISLQNKKPALVKVMLVCLGLMVLLVIPYAFTEKYVAWTNVGIYTYTISYYTFWLIAIIVVILISWLIQRCKRNRKFMTCILALAFGGIAFCTQLNNEYYADVMEANASDTWLWIDFMESEYIKSLPQNAIVYCDGYLGIYENLSSEENYINTIHNKNISLINNLDDLTNRNELYYVRIDNENDVIYCAEVGVSDYMTDELILYSDKNLKNCSVKIDGNNFREIMVNGKSSGYYNGDAIVTLDVNGNNIVIAADDIDIRDVQLINEKVECNKYVNMQYDENFYGEEEWGRWLNNNAQIELENLTDDEVCINLSFDINTGDPAANIEVKLGENSYCLKSGIQDTHFEETILIPPGDVQITFITDAKQVDAPNDLRELYMRIKNINLIIQ